ncbi:hypothetical protein [Chitinivibrio alkaliphilus]|uniref:Uncharacterized protein n=1 Tax=Chitinivibrio alkaliphilus ACht1 TaxID=1313304 RepID=U7D6Z7_9BACT|nr:hypothetical protein [Chitinivibrio alkaliphilus]ERP38745.1 hypothetical protein CALK_0764 [Chitinivibrio alkaliphilus ACht1]
MFAQGTPLDLTYSFPFYRFSWLRRLSHSPTHSFEIGLSLQIRNAQITFADRKGDLLREEQDIGPVPAFKVRLHRSIHDSYWIGLEADGMYAPVRYINGSDSDVEGAILDASLRAGRDLEQLPGAVYLNLRYLGGGAEGTSDPGQFGDGYTENWLHFLILTLGMQAHVF